MKIVFLSPGAGNMYCGNCLRDNALAVELYRQGHDVLTVPLYLPPLLDEESGTSFAADKIFFGGVNVYLEQKIPFYKYVPKFLRSTLDSRWFLKQIGSFTASTQPAKVGDMTVSMLQGEQGHQKRELAELCTFLKTEHPEIVIFSNALLLGMHNAVKDATGAKTVCMLSGEDSFLDNLTEPYQTQSQNLIAGHLAAVDIVTAPSQFYANFMKERLPSAGLVPLDIKILPPGINLDGYSINTGKSSISRSGNAVGYFARITQSKGLDTLIDAFIEVRNRNNFIPELKIGGSCCNTKFIKQQSGKLENDALDTAVNWYLNLSRSEKINFLESLTLFSVPSRLNEPFGLFVLEAFAAGVPSLYPNRGAFPEIAEQSGACILFEPENPIDLADKIEELLADENRRKEMSANGQRIVRERWNIGQSVKTFLSSI